MIEYHISVTMDPPDLPQRLESIPRRVIDPEFRRMMFLAEGYAKQNVTGGNPLNVQTGRLRSSINHSVENAGQDWKGLLGSNVVYAPIHEFGGTIPTHKVVPVRARALRFIINGAVVFSKYANIPAITMPERPFLRPAANKAIEGFVARLTSIDLVRQNG